MTPSAGPPTIHLLRLSGFPLLRQLFLEEALFRAHSDNWFVLNDGVAEPAIVLGISGKPNEMVHLERAAAAGVPIIRRFTGGGTVVVDSDSILTSLIIHGPSTLPELPCYPRPIMSWTEKVYAPLLSGLGGFKLEEHDYVIGPHKVGGNAQAISRDRWLHHTSFLWDYSPERMNLLANPKRAPEYRAGRDHDAFVKPLRSVFQGTRGEFVDGLWACLESAGFRLKEGTLKEAEAAMARNTLFGSKTLPIGDFLPS